VHLKNDERILGDSDFVNNVLSTAAEALDRRYALRALGWDDADFLSTREMIEPRLES